MTGVKGRSGRPTFKVTRAKRADVELYAASGMSHDHIARAIGCSDETLRRYFADELEYGAARKLAEMRKLLLRAAKKGNVTAQRTLAQLFSETAAHQSITGDERQASQPQPSAPKRGKKEIAADEAATAGVGTDWGDDLHIGGARTLN